MEFIDYVRAVRKRKILVIVGTAVCTVAAMLGSVRRTEVYEAAATLLVAESMIPPEGALAYPSDQVIRTFGMTYRDIVKSKSSLSEVIAKHKLGDEPYGLVLEDLERIVTVEPVRTSKLLRVKVRFSDARVASDIANFVAEQAVDLVESLSASGGTRSKDIIGKHLRAAAEELGDAETRLLEFTKKAKLPIVEKEMEILLERKMHMETEFSATRALIAEHQQSLASVEKELAGRSRTIKLSRHLAEDPLYHQALAGLADTEVQKIFGLRMEVEVEDPTYTHVEQRVVDLRSALDGLLAKRDSLQEQMETNGAELDKLQEELATKRTEVQRLERTYSLTDLSYRVLAEKFGEASIKVASRSQDLKIVDPAVVPARPMKRRRTLTVGAAALVSLVFFVSLASFFEYLQIAEKRQG